MSEYLALDKNSVTQVHWNNNHEIINGPESSKEKIDSVINIIYDNINNNAAIAIKNSELSNTDKLITEKTQYVHPADNPYVPKLTEANRVLKTFDNNGIVGLHWDIDETGIPNGGSVGQLLAKSSNGLEWINKELPAISGNNNKILHVKSDSNTLEWIDIPTELPTLNGNKNKVLYVKNDESGVIWSELESDLPELTGNNNKILQVNSSGTDVTWSPVSSIFSGLSNNNNDNKGKILIINQDGNPEWVDFIPSINTDDTSKVLSVKSGSDKTLEWRLLNTPDASSVLTTINGYDNITKSNNDKKLVTFNSSGVPTLTRVDDSLESIDGLLDAGNVLTLVTDTSSNGVKPSWQKLSVKDGLNGIDGLNGANISSADNGKVLIVDGGQVKWITIDKIPDHTDVNKGQVLTVKNDNSLGWTTISVSNSLASELPTGDNEGKTIIINQNGEIEWKELLPDKTNHAGDILAVNSNADDVEWVSKSNLSDSVLKGITGLQTSGTDEQNKAANSGKVLSINSNGEFVWSEPASGLPTSNETGTEDSSSNTVLTLQNGEAKWVNITKSSGLPDYSSASDGQVLTLVDNEGTLTPSWISNTNNISSGNLMTLACNAKIINGVVDEGSIIGLPDNWKLTLVNAGQSYYFLIETNNVYNLCLFDSRILVYTSFEGSGYPNSEVETIRPINYDEITMNQIMYRKYDSINQQIQLDKYLRIDIEEDNYTSTFSNGTSYIHLLMLIINTNPITRS